MPDLESEFSIPTPRLFHWSPGSEGGPGPVLSLKDSLGISVWLVHLDGDDSQFEDPPIDACYGEILSPDELVRAKRFVKPRDRVRFARCRASVREILGRIQDIPPSALRFGTGPFGKPYLLEGGEGASPSSIEFNVTHSGGLALVAACRGRSIGIDLEQFRVIRESERIVASFFTESEQNQFASVPEADRPIAFLRGWTRKEAILKGIGKGLAGGPSNYETMFGTSELSAQFRAISPAPLVADWMLWEASIAEGYIATLAAAVPPSLGYDAKS